MDEDSFGIGFVIGAIIVCLLTMVVLKSFYHEKAITHGIAHYDASTGDFVWNKEKCNAVTK